MSSCEEKKCGGGCFLVCVQPSRRGSQPASNLRGGPSSQQTSKQRRADGRAAGRTGWSRRCSGFSGRGAVKRALKRQPCAEDGHDQFTTKTLSARKGYHPWSRYFSRARKYKYIKSILGIISHGDQTSSLCVFSIANRLKYPSHCTNASPSLHHPPANRLAPALGRPVVAVWSLATPLAGSPEEEGGRGQVKYLVVCECC